MPRVTSHLYYNVAVGAAAAVEDDGAEVVAVVVLEVLDGVPVAELVAPNVPKYKV